MHLREIPKLKLDPKVQTYWRIRVILSSAIALAVVVGLLIAAYFLLGDEVEQALLYKIFILASVLILIRVLIGLFTTQLRYKNFSYQLNERDLDVISGVFIKTRTITPLNRVQNVSTTQGPVQRAMGFSQLVVETAAGSQGLDGLSFKDAEVLRQRISALARIEQEDV